MSNGAPYPAEGFGTADDLVRWCADTNNTISDWGFRVSARTWAIALIEHEIVKL